MKIIKNLAVVVVTASLFSCGNQMKEVKSLETEIDSVSYAVGLSMANQLKFNFKEVDKAVLLQAISNGLDSTNLLIAYSDTQAVLTPFFNKKREEMMKEQQAKQEEEAAAKFGENKKAGEDFLAENKNKPGIITTASGLQYMVMKEGKGEKPASAATKVKVHYHGTNLEGKVFDSSVDRGEPSEFALNQVIPGWTEGLQLMTVGSKYKFFIPQELAYKAAQRGPQIKPFSTLIFEVELLEIVK
ncbi:FKBP-type peptidyl-prolyl cis-trans isomerase [uncultured Polaribacter sp.]|uniref:FKBP-type peptidyl-prolyl cis-trans isomerase n=1 Tax=uncultured Polaribacter sp. TaxID=174711 RepID=UPI0026270627|nr:FKBP-type peptidyl-prolyl cis-trans isomerase [uncultured Polaribacter sp.]